MSHCPRCHSSLESHNGEALCSQGHGVLWSLDKFRQETNRSFPGWLFSTWLRRKNKRTIPCPSCKTRMIQMNLESSRSFDLDSCPGCYSLWLDWGEDLLLKKIFFGQEAFENNPSSDKYRALGLALLEEDQIRRRYKQMERVGKILRLRVHRFNQHRIFLSLFADWDFD